MGKLTLIQRSSCLTVFVTRGRPGLGDGNYDFVHMVSFARTDRGCLSDVTAGLFW
jgi:hypothetical protein